MVETLKVSDDRKALILRLLGVSGKSESATVTWRSMKPTATFLTDLTEKPLTPLGRTIDVPAYGVVQMRAELPATEQK